MREHMGLYRGKRIDNGEWVEGFYHRVTNNWTHENVHYITCFQDMPLTGETILTVQWEVFPNTVGECTGLRDKNGKLIFERHVLMYGGNIGYVNYGTGCFCVKSCTPDWRNRNNPAIDIIFNEYPNDVVIIGELEDFPELLKGGEGDG